LYWGARRRVGFAVGGRGVLLTDRVRRPASRAHQVDEYLLLVEHLGLAAATRVPSLAPPSEESETRRDARRLLDEATARRPGPRVGLHLGADYGPAKLWPARRVIEACRALADAGLTAVLLGTSREAALAETIVAATGAASLVGRDDPATLPAVLADLDALIAGDTGVSHLAAALGTPVVALFGPTDPTLTAPRGPAEVLTHPVPCAPCFYRVCPIEHPCLARIPAARVVAEIEQALADRGVAGRGDAGVTGRAIGGLGGRPEPPNFK
jgi:ADP-heptose:LPS heptosyltransferase